MSAHSSTAIADLRQKPDIMVITGDLADSGDEHAYHMLYEALSPLAFPSSLYRAIMTAGTE